MNRDTALFLGYAVGTAAVAVATSRGWLSAGDALEVSGLLTAFATAFHIPNAKAAAALREVSAAPAAGEHRAG